MEGGDFYEYLLKKKLAVEYIKKLEAAVASDSLINIRTNYLMMCIANTPTDNLMRNTGLSKTNKRLSNTKIKEPNAGNQKVLSEKDEESNEDGLELPDEVKFEILSDSEPEELSNENLRSEEQKSKRLCKIKQISKNGISHEIEDLTDLNLIENEESTTDSVFNLINNAVIMENIFSYLPLVDLLNCRTVSTDWDKQIISYLDKNNILRDITFEDRNIEEFISLVKSSKHVPFTKFNVMYEEKKTIQELFTICGSSTKHLEIEITDFTEKLSRLVPNIESLHLGDLDINSKDDSYDEVILFSKLTEIKYTPETNGAVRTFFQSTPNLNRLEIRNPQSVHEKYIFADLVSAGRLANITKLHLDTLGESTFQTLFNAASTTGLFLEEFCVNSIDKDIDLDDLTEFLSSQGKSLKKLEIQSVFVPPKPLKPSKQSKSKGKPYERKIHKLKLKKMIALTSLSFYIENDGLCPQTENVLDDLPNLVQVKIPKVCDCAIVMPFCLQFGCSTVTKLELGRTVNCKSSCDQDIIASLGIMFPSVKYLKLDFATPEYVKGVTTVWPTLKHLELDFIYFYIKGVMNLANHEIHSLLPSLVELKDLKTLSIFESQSEPVKQNLFIRF